MSRSRPHAPGRMLGREPSWWAAQLALLALAAYHLWKITGCLDGCYADIEELFGIRIGQLSFPDMRLNSWILAWVQRALLGAPASLFDANAFHPAEGGLTGSEHMLGVSIPLLPLSVFGPGAVLLHQLATVLSFLIMGWTTFALTRWLTRSDWAALVAALTAMFMPWRIFELAHVQLLSAHWIPLVWLLIGKIMTGEGRRWTAPLLSLVLLLQLASSYYLAYYVSASIAVLVPVLALRHGLQRDRLARLGAAFAAAYVPFVLISLPYLQREAGAELILMGAANLETSLQDFFAFLGGRSPGMASESPRPTYQVPLCVLLLAALGAALGRFRLGPPEAPHRLGSFAMALWLIVIAALVFVLGNEVRIGEHTFSLPGRLASEWVPGFRHLRTPARWLFLVGIAAPVLAGIGVSRMERALAGLARSGSRAGLLGLRVAVVVLVALDMRWQTIPIRSIGLESIARPYEVLRELPPGPVVEIPWPTSRLREADTGSRYMLASTLHWKPILNGFAPYPPRTYPFLHRLAWQLPSEDALEKLTRLTGLRWIVVHVGQLAGTERSEWERLISEGAVRRMFEDPATWVLEVVDREGASAWEEAIRSPTPRTRTLTGLTREPIVVSEGSSHLEVEVAPVLARGAVREVHVEVEARIENGTARSWPGIDIQTEGLVQLRYQFLSHGTSALDGTIPLYVDVPAMESRVIRGLLQPPEEPGVYQLRFMLVQQLGGEFVPLGVGAVERRVTVRGHGPPR